MKLIEKADVIMGDEIFRRAIVMFGRYDNGFYLLFQIPFFGQTTRFEPYWNDYATGRRLIAFGFRWLPRLNIKFCFDVLPLHNL